MKLNFFSKFFKKDNKKDKLFTPDSILVKKLKSTCTQNNYKILKDITVYHHSDKIYIPLIIFDPNRGLYIIENKDWSYDDLKNYEIKKSQNNENSKNTLAYDRTNNFINTKFNEILHNDFIKTFNYLITENLSFADYKHLSDEKKSLLPNKKIIFSDTNEDDILKKLRDASEVDEKIADTEYILANLLTQYMVFNNGNIFLANKDQIAYIEDELYYEDTQNIVSLNGFALSGKTTALILKAIYLKLLSYDNSVTIIQATILSCDLVKQSILELVEYSIVNIDIASIHVYTPEEFLNSKTTSYVLCDDSSLIEDNLLQKIISKSAKSMLTLVNPTKEYEHYYKLTKSYHNHSNVEFIQKNPIASAMHILHKYTKDKQKSTLTISSTQVSKKLSEELEFFLEEKVVLLDGSKKLIDQTKSLLMLSDYKNINAQRSDIIILLDVCEVSQQELSYAINLAKEKVYLIYEEECESITTLQKIFNKEKK
jgi:hypothetical protein